MHFPSISVAASLVAGALAWGNLGHETVALVAYNHLADSTAQYLNDLLNSNNPKGYDFADSATWADRIKLARPYTKPWHYIDARDRPPKSCTLHYPADCGDNPSQGCIITAIANYTAIFMDTSNSQGDRKDALMFIMHFFGDLHQPLHTEDFERGGNEIHACFGSRTLPCGDIKTHNLHHVWDTNIPHKICGLKTVATPDQEKAAAQDWAARLVAGQRADGVVAAAECTDTANPDTCSLAWAREANRYVCSAVLKPLDSNGVDWYENTDLSDEYYTDTAPVVEYLIGKAGVRLAAWLEAMVAQAQGPAMTADQQVLGSMEL